MRIRKSSDKKTTFYDQEIFLATDKLELIGSFVWKENNNLKLCKYTITDLSGGNGSNYIIIISAEHHNHFNVVYWIGGFLINRM